METFCAASGLKIFSKAEWTNKKLSDSCGMTFSILGNAILYSAPEGNFDLEGIKKSIQLKEKVKIHILEGTGPYVQILDYSALKGSALAARKIFIKDLNDDERLLALIFCNLSLPLSTAVKIGKQFISTDKIIQTVNHYVEAVKLAVKLCGDFNLNQELDLLDKSFCLGSSDYSRKQVVLNVDNDWNIQTPGFSSHASIIDNCIIHSKSEGYLDYEHLSLINQVRTKCQAELPKDSTLDYIVVNTSQLKGMSRKARIDYMKYLKEWHEQYPFRIYIVYGGNTFMNTVVHLASPLMPFKIKTVKDFDQALYIIRKDKLEFHGKKQTWEKGEDSIHLVDGNIKKILAFIASLNWEQKGVDSNFLMDEKHPFNIIFQSIKLMKEEFDGLLNEQKQLTESLHAREQLLKKQTEELIASNELLTKEIAIRKKTEKALTDSHNKLEQNTISLKESNIALKVLLKQREDDKKEIEDKILQNVEKLIIPYLEKLKPQTTGFEKNTYLEIIESNLKEITSPFSHSLSDNLLKLTPAEVQVADLVRQGKTTKDIAKLLRLSPSTVATHRQRIRRKLALTNKKLNLQTNLQKNYSN